MTKSKIDQEIDLQLKELLKAIKTQSIQYAYHVIGLILERVLIILAEYKNVDISEKKTSPGKLFHEKKIKDCVIRSGIDQQKMRDYIQKLRNPSSHSGHIQYMQHYDANKLNDTLIDFFQMIEIILKKSCDISWDFEGKCKSIFDELNTQSGGSVTSIKNRVYDEQIIKKPKSSQTDITRKASVSNVAETVIKTKPISVAVTSGLNEDIESALTSLNIKYKEFVNFRHKYDILFLNCLSFDNIDFDQLRSFVEKGGCVYASCYADEILKKAFPGIFITDHSGTAHKEALYIEDPEISAITGSVIDITFNSSWTKIYSVRDSLCLLRSTENEKLPIVVSFKYGNGHIIYSGFHNSFKSSNREKSLIKLIVLKLIGKANNTNLADAVASYNYRF